MKKSLMILIALFAAMFVQAKNRTVVIKGAPVSFPNKTEVASAVDTLTISPSREATTIYVILKDVDENVLEVYSSPAQWDDCFCIITPTLPTGYILEVRDDKGTVYREEE